MIFIDFIFLLCILFIRGSKRIGFRMIYRGFRVVPVFVDGYH